MKKWAIVAAAFLMLLTGCSEKKSVEKPKENGKVVDHVTGQEEEHQEPAYSYPLTGKKSEEKTDGRAVAVMINNHPKARPQSGLNKADLIYEILAEGDVTRFLAVFQSEMPVNIGPVRSARDYYIELAKGLKALYIAHGYSPEAKKMLESNYIDNINGIAYDGTLFKRSTSRKAPHNSYITYENVLKGVELKNYSMDETPPRFHFLTEEQQAALTGSEAKIIKVIYSKRGTSNSTYEFDPSLGKYKRFSGGELTIDLDSKEPVLLDNIFIIEAEHKVIDSEGRREIDLATGGKAYLFQMGKVNEITWENKEGRIIPVKDGNEVPFVPGKTWVNVVPRLSESVSFDGQ